MKEQPHQLIGVRSLCWLTVLAVVLALWGSGLTRLRGPPSDHPTPLC
jgi:hypothetical protein